MRNSVLYPETVLRLLCLALSPVILLGTLVESAAADVEQIEFEVAVASSSSHLVRRIEASITHDQVALPGNPVTLRASGDRYVGSLRVPPGLSGRLHGKLSLHTQDTTHLPVTFIIKPIPLNDPAVGPTVRVVRQVRFMRLEIEAEEEVEQQGTITLTPVEPDVTLSVPSPSGAGTRRIGSIPRGSFVHGSTIFHVPVDAFALPAGTVLTLAGRLRGSTIPGGFNSLASATVVLVPDATRTVTLTFRDWLRAIREAMLPVLRSANVPEEAAQRAVNVEIRPDSTVPSFARWVPPVNSQGDLFPWVDSRVEIAPALNPSSPAQGETLTHEIVHELLHRAGWQPRDPPSTGHNVLVPASATTLAWEEGLCHLLGGLLIATAIEGEGGLTHTGGGGWRDDVGDGRRGTAVLWTGQANPNLAGHVVQLPGNWIEGIGAAALVELYAEAGCTPRPLPQVMLRVVLADLDAFCGAVDRAEWDCAHFLAFLRGRPMPAPSGVPWGRMADQVALWYRVMDPADMPPIDELVPVEIAADVPGDAEVGRPAVFTAHARAFRRLVRSKTYAPDTLRLRLYEGSTQLGGDVELALDSSRPGFTARAPIEHTWTTPGPHTVHAQLWSRAVDGAPQCVGRSRPVDLVVREPALRIELSAPTTRPGDRVEARKVGARTLQGDEGYLWEGSDGLDFSDPNDSAISVTVLKEGTLTLKVVGNDGKERAEASVEVKFPLRTSYVVSGSAQAGWTFAKQSNPHGSHNFKAYAIHDARWCTSDVTGLQLVKVLDPDHYFMEQWLVQIPVEVTILGDVRILASGNFQNWPFTVYLDPSYPNWIHEIRVAGFPPTLGPDRWHFIHNYHAYHEFIFRGVKGQSGNAGSLRFQPSGDPSVTYLFDLEEHEADDQDRPQRKVGVTREEFTFPVRVFESHPPAPPTTPVTVTLRASDPTPRSPGVVTVTADVSGARAEHDPLTFRWSGVDASTRHQAEVHVITTGERRVSCEVMAHDGAVLGAAALTIDANLACRVDLSVSFDAALPFVGSGATLRASVQCVDGGAPPPKILYRWEPHPEIEFAPHEGPVANARARFLIPGPTRLWVAALVPDGDRWVTLAESDPVEIEVVEPVLSLEALPTTATVGQRTSVQASFDPPIRTSEVTLAWTVAQAVDGLEESEDGGTLVFTPRTAVLHEVRVEAYLTELGDSIGEAVLWVPALPAGPGPAGDLHGRALAGDTVAQALLGKFHLKRDAGEADRAEAVRWLTQAAEGGDTSAQRMLGYCLVYGRGVAKDEAAGLRWIERARQGGDDHAPYLLAALEDRVDASPEQVARVRALLQEAAARGSAAAMHGLGTLYERGRSTRVDYAEAARWYLAAAQAGHAEGQRMAGRFLLSGLGGTKDRERGLDLLHRAAQQGGAEAQLELAEALGPGTAEGRGWLERAARQGEAGAAEALGRVYLTGDGTPVDASRAARWLQRAADAPFAGSAAFALAALYERGEGVNRDLGLALYYYRRASEGIVWRSGGGEDGVARAQERVRALESARR